MPENRGMMNFDFGTRFQVQLQVSDGWQQSPGTATLTVTRTDSELTRSTRRNLNSVTQTSFKFIIMMSNLNNLKGRLPAATVTRPGAQRGGP
jgi:hypothetical protein